MLGRFSKILVVDDSATMRKLVVSMLSKIGYDNAHQASDGRSALAILAERRFALVVSDWNMAPMNGLELLREMRKLSPPNGTPFIMMTAHSVKFAAIARDEGTIHYLIKPFTVSQLAAKVVQVSSGLAA